MTTLERKYYRIADHLREQIRSGTYVDRIPGERDLAESYGVHVLTANKAVSSLVEEGLLYRVKGRGTFVTRLKRARTGTLAAVVGDVLAPLHARIVRGMEAAARRSGQHLLFCSRGYDAGREDEFIEQVTAQEKADGFLIWPWSYDLESPGLRRAADSGLPFVVFPHIDPAAALRVSHVISDDRDGARAAVEHLLDRRHRQIGFVFPSSWEWDHILAGNRWAGCQDAIGRVAGAAARRIPWHEVERLSESLTGLLEAVDRGKLTALFCCTDSVAIQVLKALRDAGVSVPGELSIIGFDGTPAAADFNLTTFEQPMEEIGASAVDALLDEIEGGSRMPARVTLQGRLIVRSTTRALD